MQNASTRSERSPVQWGVNLTIALSVAIAGYFAVADSLSQALRKRKPELAFDLAPWNGRSRASFAAKLAGPKATARQRAESSDLARMALRQDPTAVAAVVTLGINTHLRDGSSAARRYFSYSDKLSRRDLRTRIWIIGDAADQNRISYALRNYDIAMRTSRAAPGFLFPVLARAISHPEISQALVRTLAARPAWGKGFLAYLASTSSDPTAMARLFAALHKVGLKTSDDINATALERLVRAGAYQPAWSFYSQIRRGIDHRRSRDPQFARFDANPTIFDWLPAANKDGISASILPSERHGLFDFAAPPSVGGILLQQMQLLPPGSYRLVGRSSGIEQAKGAHPYWALICVEGTEVGRLEVPNSREKSGLFEGRFAVPQGCKAQYLRLVARPSNAATGLSGQILEAGLAPEK